ncbi:hypothetical protein KY358_05450 [Candidatus Woesearchaeota archaeon]|nr:hypothetical protein [Candidatus Woesearchaeota archaeon]
MKDKRLIWIFAALVSVAGAMAAEEALSPAGNIARFIVNVFVVFSILFLVQIFLLKDVIKDKNQKKIVYVLIMAGSLFISWAYGRSGYIWSRGKYAAYINPQFIVNSVIFTLILFILYEALAKKHMPQGKEAKFGATILLLLLGIGFAGSLYRSPSGNVGGKPVYLWETNWWSTGKNYLFSPPRGIFVLTKANPNLVILIVSFFFFIWLFNRLLSADQNKLPVQAKIALSLLLAAQIASGGYSLNSLLELIYWIILILMYIEMKKNADNNKSWGMQFGLYWAVMDIVAEMIGGKESCVLCKFGNPFTVQAGQIDFIGRILMGMIIGKILSVIWNEGGMLKNGMKAFKERVVPEMWNKTLGRIHPVLEANSKSVQECYNGFSADAKQLAIYQRKLEKEKADIAKLEQHKDNLISEIKDLVREWRELNLRGAAYDSDRRAIWDGQVAIPGNPPRDVNPSIINPLTLDTNVLDAIINGPNTGLIKNAVSKLYPIWRVVGGDPEKVDPNCAIGKHNEEKKDYTWRGKLLWGAAGRPPQIPPALPLTRTWDVMNDKEDNHAPDADTYPALDSIRGLTYKMANKLEKAMKYDEEGLKTILNNLGIKDPRYQAGGGGS